MQTEAFDIHGDFWPFDFQARYNEGYRIVILKATGGHNFVNPNLAKQVAAARQAGLKLGFYHFMFEPTSGGGDWQREATNFVTAVAQVSQPGDRLWLDVEANPAEVGYKGYVGDFVVSFNEFVGTHFATTVGVYTGTYYLQEQGMTRDTRLAKYPLWFASWQDRLPAGSYMAPWAQASMWQYNADQLDKDHFYGSTDDWTKLGIPAKEGTKIVQKVDTQAGNEIRTGILADGRPYVQVVFAGQTAEVAGANVADLGISVYSITEPHLLLDQSVQGNEFKGWRERR